MVTEITRLTEKELLSALNSVGDSAGRVTLTYEFGPYDILRPTNVAQSVCRAIELAIHTKKVNSQ